MLCPPARVPLHGAAFHGSSSWPSVCPSYRGRTAAVQFEVVRIKFYTGRRGNEDAPSLQHLILLVPVLSPRNSLETRNNRFKRTGVRTPGLVVGGI